jgi:hypothetical protein
LVVGSDDLQAIFVKWCDEQRELYAVIVEHGGIQTITGHITAVKDGVATLTDKIVEVQLPIGAPTDVALTSHADEVRSVTMSWETMSVFVVAKM